MPVYQDGTLRLYGVVGGDSYWEAAFSASDVVEALAEHGRDNDLTVHINSPGGVVSDGVAIYNALIAHKGKVRVEIDALALSSASLIAMAGDEIVMRTGALMMIHDPSGTTSGPAAEHEKTRNLLDKIAGQMAGIYADRSGKPVEDVRAAMRDELWLTETEAVAQGYATAAEAAQITAWAAFDYRVYAKAPRALTALAAEKGWKISAPLAAHVASLEKPAAPAASSDNKEPTMSDKNPAAGATAAVNVEEIRASAGAEAIAAYKARRGAVLALDEAKGRETLAETLLETELSVEQIKAALAAAPAAGNGLDIQAYENARAAGAGLSAQPPATGGDHGWGKVVARINKSI